MRIRGSVCPNGRRARTPSSCHVPLLILLPLEIRPILRILPGILHRGIIYIRSQATPLSISAAANSLRGVQLLSMFCRLSILYIKRPAEASESMRSGPSDLWSTSHTSYMAATFP